MMIDPFDLKSALLAKHAQHVVVVHFPIALFISSVAFDLMAMWKNNRALAKAAYYNLLAAALTAVAAVGTGGNFFLFEHSNLLPGGPPLHLHYNQEEWFYVIEGEVLVQIGKKRFQLKPGDSLLAPRKVPHAFTAVGATPAKMHVGYSPADKIEQFFRVTANGKPVRMDAALFRKYDCELLGPPLKTT